MYTRRGDGGETSLYGSRRVPKDDPRVEAYGTIDELNSVLGMVVAGTRRKELRAPLKEVQALLFTAGGDAATELGSAQAVPRISASDTARIEELTDKLLAGLPPIRNFILPGGSPSGAALHLARAVCRRAERNLVAAGKAEKMNPELIPFFNRLSSYLFNLSRWENRRARKRDEVWKPKTA